MYRVERCGHGTNLERRRADDLDVGDFALEVARMHRVERCGHGTNLERRGANDLDVGTLSSNRYKIYCHFDFTSSWYCFDFMMTSLLSWLECIVLRGVDIARTLSEEELMTLMLVPCHRTVIKSAVILTSLRLGIVSTS